MFLLWINILDPSTSTSTHSSSNVIGKRNLSVISSSSESSIFFNDNSSDEYLPPFNEKYNVSNSESNESIRNDKIETNSNTLNQQIIPNAEKNNFESETDQQQQNEQGLSSTEENEFVQQTDNLQKNKRGRKKNEGLKTRKRLSNSKAWVRNFEKEKKAKGLEYVNSKNKIIKKKSLLPPCSCRMKCFEKFSNENRETILYNYYNLPKESQQQFIASSVIETDKKVQRVRKNKDVASRRKYSRLYFLSKGNENIKVCQIMFLNTLSITLKQVRCTVEKKD